MKINFSKNPIYFVINLIFSLFIIFSLYGDEKRPCYELKTSGSYMALLREDRMLFEAQVGWKMTGHFDEEGHWTYCFDEPIIKKNNGCGTMTMLSPKEARVVYKENNDEFEVNFSDGGGEVYCCITKINTQANVVLNISNSLALKNVVAHNLKCIGDHYGTPVQITTSRGTVKVDCFDCKVEKLIIGSESVLETSNLIANNIDNSYLGMLKMNGKAPQYNSITWKKRFKNDGFILSTGDLDLDTKENREAYFEQDGAGSFEVNGKLTCRMQQAGIALESSKIFADSIAVYARTVHLGCAQLENQYVNDDYETNAFESGRSPSILCAREGNMVIYAGWLTNNAGLIISKQGMALTIADSISNKGFYQWRGVFEERDYPVEWIPASIISGDTMMIAIKNEECLLDKDGAGCALMGLRNTGTFVANGILKISTDNVTKIINGIKNKRVQYINYNSLEKKVIGFSLRLDDRKFSLPEKPDVFRALVDYKSEGLYSNQPLVYSPNKNIPYVYTDPLKLWDGKPAPDIGSYVNMVQSSQYDGGYEFPHNIYTKPHLRLAYSPDVETQLVDQTIISSLGTRLPGFKDAQSQWEALRNNGLQKDSLRDLYYRDHKPFLIYTEDNCLTERCYIPVIFMRGQEELLKTNPALIQGKQTIINAPYSEVINFGTIRSLENVTITAKIVKNISPGMSEHCRVGSKVYEIRTQLPGGMIVGFDVDINVGSDPTDKDKTVFSNEGGTVFASHNVNLYAKYGDQEIKPFLGSHVVAWNSGTLGEMFGAKDSSLVVDYKAGRIAADNNIKMIAEAGHILGEASELIAGNDANIKGAQGVLFRTLMSTYVENEEVNLFSASHRENVSTGTMKVSSLHNINIESSEGKTEGIGVAYEAADKLFFKGKKGNEQRAAAAQLNYWNASWGMTPAGFFYETTKVRDEHIVQTTVSAREVVYETDFDNVFEAVIMCGKDAIHVTAGRDNKFVGHDRKTTVEQNGITLGISYPGSDLLAGLTGPGFMKYAENHEMSKLLQRLKNGNPYDIAADSTKLLIDALRTALDYKDKVMKAGMGNVQWLSSHLGFTDGVNFNPSLQFRLGATHATQESHEKTGSAINTVNFVSKSGGKTVFADGTEVNVDYADIDGSDVTLVGAEDFTETTSIGGGVTISFGATGIHGVGADASYEQSSQKTHKQTTLKARKVKMHCKTLGIVDAFVSTEIMDGKVSDKFYVIQHPDMFKKTSMSSNVYVGADSASVGVNTAHVNNNESKQQSGLHADTGNLETPLTEMTGATRINGSFTLNTTKLVGHETVDTSHNDTLILGLSASPNAHVAQGMAEISKETGNKQTVNRPTIDPTVNVQTQNQQDINRDTSKMQEVISDKRSYFRLAIPLINQKKCAQDFEDLKDMFRGKKQALFDEMLNKFNEMEDLAKDGREKDANINKEDQQTPGNSENQGDKQQPSDSQADDSQNNSSSDDQDNADTGQKQSANSLDDFEVRDDNEPQDAKQPPCDGQTKKQSPQKHKQNNKSQENSSAESIKDQILKTDFDLKDKNDHKFHIKALSDLGDGDVPNLDPKTFTILGEDIDPLTGAPRMTVKIGRHMFQINPEPEQPKAGACFSKTPIEGATYVPGWGWKVEHSYWDSLSSQDKADIIAVGISTLLIVADAYMPPDEVKEGLNNIISNVKQSGIGRIGSRIYEFAKPGIQAARSAIDSLKKLFGLGRGASIVLPKERAIFTIEKLQHEFQHSADFGILGNWNKVNGELYKEAISQHINSATNIYKSMYRGQEVFVYLNKNTRVGAYTDMLGSYIGGWKFSTEQINFHMMNGIKIMGD